MFVAACRLSLIVLSEGYSLVAVRGLLIVVISLVAEHRLQGVQASVTEAPGLWTQAQQLHGMWDLPE